MDHHRLAFHRARLVDNITPYDIGANQVVDGLTVNRHAAVMAYNDVFWLMGMLFILSIPFLIMLGNDSSKSTA